MIRHILDKTHRFLAKSKTVVRLVLLIRNQCNCILKYHLSEDANPGKNGEYELIETVCAHTNSIVDVGANKGEYIEFFIKSNPSIGRALLIEPSLIATDILRHKFEKNPNIEIVQCALSDYVGESLFYEEQDAGETSSMLGQFSNSGSSKKTIRVSTLDAELAKRGIKNIDFLKVDTEGSDFNVLKGAKEFLAGQRIGIIQFEYNSPWAFAGSTLYAAIQYMKSMGYETYLLKSDGLYTLDYTKYSEFYTYANFVSVNPVFLPHVQSLLRGTI